MTSSLYSKRECLEFIITTFSFSSYFSYLRDYFVFLIFYVYQLQYTEATTTKKTLFLRCFLEVRGDFFCKFDLLIDSLTM